MSAQRRAEWLLARRLQWCGLAPREVVEGELSPRVEGLVVEMRAAGLFPDTWDEQDVLFAFLGAVAEARLLHRHGYLAQVRRSERLGAGDGRLILPGQGSMRARLGL